MTTYRIVRYYQSGEPDRRGLPTGLSLEEAQERCRDPEGSSRTCNKREGHRRTAARGNWFEGYEEE